MSRNFLKKYLSWFLGTAVLAILPIAAQEQLPTWTLWIAVFTIATFSAMAVLAGHIWLYQLFKERKSLADLNKAIDLDTKIILAALEKVGDSSYALTIANLLHAWVEEGLGQTSVATAIRSHLRTISLSARTAQKLRNDGKICALEVHRINEQLMDAYVQICESVSEARMHAREKGFEQPPNSRFKREMPQVIRQTRVLIDDIERTSKRINIKYRGYGAREYFPFQGA